MAANNEQGRSFTTFVIGLILACVGVAFWSTGFGKLTFIIGLIIFAASMVWFLKLKPLEGKPANNASPTTMKALGAFLAALGWVITLFGMHIVDSTSGRLVLALVGIGVSLFGMVYVLPAAFNRNAIWKA
jgi:hypothetical protein